VVVREHRLDDTPLAVAEFIAHDSKLRFWALRRHQYAMPGEDDEMGERVTLTASDGFRLGA